LNHALIDFWLIFAVLGGVFQNEQNLQLQAQKANVQPSEAGLPLLVLKFCKRTQCWSECKDFCDSL